MKRRGGTLGFAIGLLLLSAGCASQAAAPGTASAALAATLAPASAADSSPGVTTDQRPVALSAAAAAVPDPVVAPAPRPAAVVAPPATPLRLPVTRPAVAAPPPGPRRNWVEVPAVGVSVAVGVYSDCTGQTPLTRATAARDICVPSTEVFLVGHRPGVFAALPGMPANAVVNYWDDAGVLHTYRIYQVSKVPSAQGANVMDNQHPPLLMQTCDDPTGSYYYFYGADA